MALSRMMTHYMSGGINEAAGGLFTVPAMNYWLLQDDIRVYGWDYSLKVYPVMTLDGWMDAYFELSQAPTQTKDGGLVGVRIGCFISPIGVSGGAGAGVMNDHDTFIFPSDHYISVQEGEYLNLHGQVESPVGKAARMDAAIRIYYRLVYK